MNRVAFFSPLPPETSGIADYSAELLPVLAGHLRLELFTADPGAAAEVLDGELPVRGFAEFPALDADDPYDCVLYQVGNSAAHHGAIYRQLLTRPGVIVLHEYMLHSLVRDLALAGPGRREFVEQMRYCYGRRGLTMAGRLLHANNLPEMWDFPLFERVVDSALGVIVHNRTTRDRVLASRPNARLALVAHALSVGSSGGDDGPRRRRLFATHGIAVDAPFVVGSFGHLTASKRLDVSLAAFAEFRRTHPQAVYVLVGEISHAYPQLENLLAGELGAGVVTTGRVTLDELLEFMACCDVAINLRHPTGGETSGACLRLLGLGRATIVSNIGWFSEIPANACAQVAAGDEEVAEIAALLTALADDDALRSALGANAARWATEHHRLADSARAYAEFVDATVAQAPQLEIAVPPLAPAARGLRTALIADLAAGLGDLGLTENDNEPQRLLAGAMVDLELDRGLADGGR